MQDVLRVVHQLQVVHPQHRLCRHQPSPQVFPEHLPRVVIEIVRLPEFVLIRLHCGLVVDQHLHLVIEEVRSENYKENGQDNHTSHAHFIQA